MEIRLLDNNKIDKKAWDRCLFASPGFELYMQAAYLDIVSPKWKAFVVGNYEAVFPVFEKQFLFWKTLRQPLFTGPIKIQGTNNMAIIALAKNLPKLLHKYSSVDLNVSAAYFNTDNSYKKVIRKLQVLEIPQEGFSPNKSLRKNINKAIKQEIENTISIEPTEFISGIKKYLLSNHSEALNKASLNLLNNLLKNLSKFNGKSTCITKDKEIYAAQFFLYSLNKVYFVLCYSSNEGRKCSALHSLHKKILDTYLVSGGILNFGGSNIDRIAEYNHNFGAEDIFYTRVTRKKYF